MKTYTIEVTQEDIDKGNRLAPCSCPVALAISRATNKCAIVSSQDVSFQAYGGGFVYFDAIVRDFINKFDGRQPVQPFKFDLDIDV